MRRAGRLAAFVAAVVATVLTALPTAAAPRGTAGEFDFWVLALSWSPSWCEAEGDARKAAECARPFAFTVHGLWPQYHRGYPSDCATAAAEPSPAAVAAVLPVMPSPGLVRYQWRKHGRCSGLDGDAFLKALGDSYARIVVPAAYRAPTAPQMVAPAKIEADFIAANALPADAIAVTCDGRRLREVRICLKRDLSGPVACPEVDRAACRADRVFLPPMRGG